MAAVISAATIDPSAAGASSSARDASAVATGPSITVASIVESSAGGSALACSTLDSSLTCDSDTNSAPSSSFSARGGADSSIDKETSSSPVEPSPTLDRILSTASASSSPGSTFT